MYICVCNAITDQEIRQAADRGIRTVRDLQRTLGVAAGCGSCTEMAREILRESQHRDTVPGPIAYLPAPA